MGPFSTVAIGLLYSYPNKFLHSSPEAPRTIQARGTSTSGCGNYFASKSVIHESTRFFYMLQSWDMGQILSLPLRREAY